MHQPIDRREFTTSFEQPVVACVTVLCNPGTSGGTSLAPPAASGKIGRFFGPVTALWLRAIALTGTP